MNPRHPNYDEHPIHPFGEDDVNLWTSAVPTSTDVEIHLHLAHLVGAGHHGDHADHHRTSEGNVKPGDSDADNTSSGHTASTPEDLEDMPAKENASDELPPSSSRCSYLCAALELFKYVYSSALLVFCLVVVFSAIFTYQTTATGDFGIHPGIAFVIFWFLLLWLSMMEGGLNSIVGLQHVDKTLYANSHPKAFRCTMKAHRGDNIERFIVGRQFLDLICVFMTSIMVSAVQDAQILNLPQLITEIFFNSGLAVILVTIVFGQLMTQINAAHSMLDFINNYAMVAITHLALTVELSGLLHAVYLIQHLFAKWTGKPIESDEEPRTRLRKFFFWGRVVFSTCIFLVATVVIIMAIFDGKTTMWDSVPPAVSVILLLVLISLTGLMEGLQIAFFAVVHHDQDLDKYRVAKQNCKLVFKGKNLQTFLIGRQILQTVVMFVIARITTVDSHSDENLFGASAGLQAFFNTGLMGAFFSAIIASLCWRVLASTFPMAFLSNPASSIIIRLCIVVENSGICYSAWIVAAVNKRLVGYRLDEEYLGATAAADLDAAAAEIRDLEEAEETSEDQREDSTDSAEIE